MKDHPETRKCHKAGVRAWNKGLDGYHAGAEHWHWSGGKRKSGKYIEVYCPGHPFAHSGNYVYEHRLVMEQKLGRYLQPEEFVHHLNKIRTDNRPENLVLTNIHEHHRLYHSSESPKKMP